MEFYFYKDTTYQARSGLKRAAQYNSKNGELQEK